MVALDTPPRDGGQDWEDELTEVEPLSPTNRKRKAPLRTRATKVVSEEEDDVCSSSPSCCMLAAAPIVGR